MGWVDIGGAVFLGCLGAISLVSVNLYKKVVFSFSMLIYSPFLACLGRQPLEPLDTTPEQMLIG